MFALRHSVSIAILAVMLGVLSVALAACSATAGQDRVSPGDAQSGSPPAPTAMPTVQIVPDPLPTATPTVQTIPYPSPTSIPTVENVPDPPPLPDQGLAPDLTNETWINADAPLTLDRLRGKVVLVEFWTFG